MTTLISHPLPVLALGLALGPRLIPPRLLLAGLLFSLLPDADVLAFKFGIAYADAFGHRGASHSLLFAGVLAMLGALLHRPLRSQPVQAAAWLFVCAISHALLDAMTSGGLGVALLWPWNEQRYFAPWRPILVSPFANGFFSARGMATLVSELRWVWLPLFAGATLWKAIHGRPHPADTDRTDPHVP